MKTKRIIIVSVIVIILSILVFSLYWYYRNKNIDDVDVSKEFLEDKEVSDMKIEDVYIEEDEGIYTFKAKVVNVSNKKIENEKVQIIFKNETEKKIYKYPYVILNIEKKQSQEIEIKTSENLKEFNTFDIKIQK